MTNILNKKSVKRVEEFLKKIDHNISIIQLELTARSAKEAAFSLNVETGAIIKSMIFKSLNNEYYLSLISGDKTVSENKLSNLTKSEIIKPNADEVKENCGFSIGGVPPIAHNTKIPTFIDESLSRYKYIYAAAGHPHCVFKTTFQKLCEITEGQISDIIN